MAFIKDAVNLFTAKTVLNTLEMINNDFSLRSDIRAAVKCVSVEHTLARSVSVCHAPTHLSHHQRAVLGAVPIRVVVGVVVTSHHAKGLDGALTRRRPARERQNYCYEYC